MADFIKEGDLDDGTEGSNVGYRTPSDAEEESDLETGEPGEEEVDEDELEGEEGLEDEEEPGEEEEPGDEEEEEEEEEEKDALPKVSKELEAERKVLQRAFTEKTKGIANLRLKAGIVDAIEANPEATLKKLAARFGVKLEGEAAPAVKAEPKVPDFSQVTPGKDEEFPVYLNRLFAHGFGLVPEMVDAAVTKAMGKGKPGETSEGAQGGLSNPEIKGILGYLDDKHPDWGLYEEKMIKLLVKHPSLGVDPEELYSLAKATSVNPRDKAAAKKKVAKAAKGKMKKSTGKVKVAGPKGKRMNFDEAWDRAKKTLRSGGE